MVFDEDIWWRPFRVVDGIRVFHVDLSPDARHEARAVAWLSKEELERRAKFIHVRAQRDYALCRAATRALLCDRLGCANHRLSFVYGDHGKPFAVVDGRPAPIGFNLSHSAPHGLIALASRGRIGVDVETRHTGRDFDGIAESVYGRHERRALAATSGDDKIRLFFRLWSMKEALIKALGTGFSLAPDRFEVPPAMIRDEDSGLFRFPHLPADAWRLEDLGETRFAAALAFDLPPGSRQAQADLHERPRKAPKLCRPAP